MQLEQFNSAAPDAVHVGAELRGRALVRDQLVRAEEIDAETLAQVTKFVDRAEQFCSGRRRRPRRPTCARSRISSRASSRGLRDALRALADSI